MTKVIVFDFDGVIVPSEEIKKEGYRRIFSEYGEIVPEEAIRKAEEEFADAKGNRFDIIRGALKEIRRDSDVEDLVMEYGERYSAIVQKDILALTISDDVLATLQDLSARYPLYVNSNNPDEALRDIVRGLQIEKYFKGLYGSSRTKVENLKTIATIEHVRPEEIVFIGDGEGDRKAAELFRCQFIGVATGLNGWSASSAPFKVINSIEYIDFDN